jgi:hypothetical protein
MWDSAKTEHTRRNRHGLKLTLVNDRMIRIETRGFASVSTEIVLSSVIDRVPCLKRLLRRDFAFFFHSIG